LGPADLPGSIQEGTVIDLDSVIWPEEYNSKTSAYALNDIDVKAPPQAM
jgi:hypothetical protein